MRIIHYNYLDSATTLAVSPSAVATLPVTNLQVQNRAVWRGLNSGSPSAHKITATWNSAKVIQAVALIRHNLTSEASWRIKLYSDVGGSNLIYDSGEMFANPPKTLGDLDWGIDPLGATVFTNWTHAWSTLWLPSDYIVMRMELYIDDDNNPDGYIQAARLFVGPYFEPASDPQFGVQLSWEDQSTQTRTESGFLRSDNYEPYRRLAFDLAYFDQAERGKIVDFFRRFGKRNDMFISIQPEVDGTLERDYAMLGKLTKMPSTTWNATMDPTWSCNIEIEET